MIYKKFMLLFIALVYFMVFVSCQTADKKEERVEQTKQTVHLSPEGQLGKIKQELKDVKTELTQAGEYNCCIHPTCNWCALQEGNCDCYDEVKAGEAVCPGCGLGWHNDQGTVEGITASQVKWDISHEHEEGEHEH
ncbi:MAG: hypothetical protein ACE5JB_09115 [bacterium]